MADAAEVELLLFAAGNPRLPRMKPLPLVASTTWWSACTVLAFAYFAHGFYFSFILHRTYPEVTGLGTGSLIAALALLLCPTCAVLWLLRSYWRGEGWTLMSVFVASIVRALFFLRDEGRRLYHFPHGGDGFFFGIRIIDFLFCVYIAYWLMTKQARRYFAEGASITDI